MGNGLAQVDVGRCDDPHVDLEGPVYGIRWGLPLFDRLQRQVERLEARVRSYEVGGEAPSPWPAEATPADPAIETELEALKARIRGDRAEAQPGSAEADAK